MGPEAQQLLDAVVKVFGAGGALALGVWAIVRYLLPRYEARTEQVIAGYEARLVEIKQQLEIEREAHQKALAAATQERKDVTTQFLAALSEQLASNARVQRELLQELALLKDAVLTTKQKVLHLTQVADLAARG